MAQYRKQILTNFSQEYPGINYDEIQDYEIDRYKHTEPYQSYSNYELPVSQKFLDKTFNYTQGNYKNSRFYTYFRPISYTENISEYNKNKYGHIKYPKDLYYISICPYCGAENFIYKQSHDNNKRGYQRNENINLNQELCENCRKKYLANQENNMNAEQLLNKTLSPNKNQSIYIMSKNPLNFGIKKCTCKRRIINLSTKNNILLTEDKDIVNQKSQNLKTETVLDMIKSIKSQNKVHNTISKEKENEFYNNNINLSENAQINNNLVDNEQKINVNDVVPSENLNLNEQNIETNKIQEEQDYNQGEDTNEKIKLNNIEQNNNDKVVGAEEIGFGGDMNTNELNDIKNENVNDININDNKEENMNLEGNYDLELNKKIEIENEINKDENEKDNENKKEEDIPQNINNIAESNENPLNEINQNELEQNELLNYNRNKVEEENYYENQNDDNIDDKENNLLNSNENQEFNNQNIEQEEVYNEKIINEKENNEGNFEEYSERSKEENKEVYNEENKEEIDEENKIVINKEEIERVNEENNEEIGEENNEKVNGENNEEKREINEENKEVINQDENNEKVIEENNEINGNINEIEQNGEYKINYVELEKDEATNNGLGENILNKKNEIDDSENIKDQQEQENLEQGNKINININANGIEQTEEKAFENNIDNNLEKNEIKQKEMENIEENQNQIISNDNNDDNNHLEEEQEGNNNLEKDNKTLEDYNIEGNVNIEREVPNEKGNLDEQKIESNKENDQTYDNEKLISMNEKEKSIDNMKIKDDEQNDNENQEDDSNIMNKKLDSNKKNKSKEDDKLFDNNMDENYENINDNNENDGEFEEMNQTGSKNLLSELKSGQKIKIKWPQSGEELFNPKKSKRKSVHHLFTKYELKEINNMQQRYSVKINDSVSIFKRAKEIFPSKYGIEMPYKSHLSHSNYSFKTSKSIEKALGKRTISGKKKINDSKMDGEYMIKEFDYISLRDSQFKIKKYGRKNYYMYKGSIRSENPFVGLSVYDKNTKERKSLIAKTVKKEGIEFNEILLLKENLIKKKEFNEKDLNQLIKTLSKFLYEDRERNLENKESYEYKIHNVSNIIKFMKKEKQKKIMDGLQKRANDEYSKELFEILKSKIDDYKEKLSKVYKIEINSGNKPHNSKLNSPIKKLVNKHIRGLSKNKSMN